MALPDRCVRSTCSSRSFSQLPSFLGQGRIREGMADNLINRCELYRLLGFAGLHVAELHGRLATLCFFLLFLVLWSCGH